MEFSEELEKNPFDIRLKVTRTRSEERCSPFNVFPWVSIQSTAIKFKGRCHRVEVLALCGGGQR